MTTDFGRMLEDIRRGALDPAVFSHRDHVAVAYTAVRRHGFFDGLAIVATGLRALATRAGAPEKFNATVTLACVSLIAERMTADEAQDADAFIRCNPDLLARDVLENWFSRERLASPLAKTMGLLPDRTPLERGGCVDGAVGAAAAR